MAMTLAILHVLLAGIVTIDVLLKKSDVRGALGWIGAVWLAPILGSLLYYLFGINRVTRRALKLNRLHEKQATPARSGRRRRRRRNIALLSEVSERVTQSPLTGGNAFAVLEGGDEAYPAMLAAIRAAKHCIAMSSYIFRDDAAGQEFAERPDRRRPSAASRSACCWTVWASAISIRKSSIACSAAG